MSIEVIRLGHDRFWYTTSIDYYPESVYYFYDRMEIDDDTRTVKVMYGNTIHTITIEVIAEVMNLSIGYITEQFPWGSQALSDCVKEIVLRDQIQDGYVKLGNLHKNQVLFHVWLNDNVIPSVNNWIEDKLNIYIQSKKLLELRADRTNVSAIDFNYVICETLRTSLKHCKDISSKGNYAYLPVLMTQIL